MKTFILIKEQEGVEPCDYCINDANVTIIKANSLEEAKEKCLDLSKNWKEKCLTIEDCDDLLEDSELTYANTDDEDNNLYCNKITLYEIEKKVNLHNFYKNRIDEIKRLKKNIKTQEEE